MYVKYDVWDMDHDRMVRLTLSGDKCFIGAIKETLEDLGLTLE